MIKQKLTFMTLFARATLHPNAHLITSLICGYRIVALKNELLKIAIIGTNEKRQGKW